MDSEEFKNLAAQMVRKVRGSRSQGQVNRAFEKGHNLVSQWETGRQRIRWRDFVELCRVCSFDIGSVVEQALVVRLDPADVSLLFSQVFRLEDPRKLAAVLECSERHAQRLVRGEAALFLDQFLQLVEQSTNHLMMFLRMMGCDALSRYPELEKSAKEVSIGLPFVGAAISCLDLPAYRALDRHESGFISKRIGISLADEQTVLQHLKDQGLIRLVNDKYQICEVQPVNASGDHEFCTAFALYWHQRLGAYLQRKDPNLGRSLCLTFNVSKDMYEKILNKVTRLHLEVEQMLAEESGSEEEVAVLLSHLRILPPPPP